VNKTTERLLVMMEDPLIHMGKQPVCSDLSCPCHQDVPEAWQESRAMSLSTEQDTNTRASEIEESPL
jgi:hypothetical protein